MTATQAGQPAKDPEDGPGASRGAPDVDGTVADGPVTVDSGVGWLDAAPLAPEGAVTGGGTAERIAALRARLITPMPDDRLWGWIGPLLVTLFAALLRFNRLSVPNAVIFDETYYAKDAWSILKHGVEWNWVANPANNADFVNNQIIAGHSNLFAACSGTSCGEYVVQPEVGKLLMAVGEWLYGLTTLGWRLAPAVFGTLAILVMCRVARRLTRSTLLGCTAGLLLSLDGLEFVLSRTGILDIFLMFFVLAAFGALVVDRDVSRARLAEAMVLEPSDEAGPGLGIRKWRVVAGVLIGLACASKQYGVWYILAFAGLCVAWDIGARRTVGLRRFASGGLLRDGKWLLLTLGVIPLVTYILTWMGWLVTNTGYDRDYAQGTGFNIPVLAPLYSLFEYHKEMVTLRGGPERPAPLHVAAVGLVLHHPAGGLLLEQLLRPGRAARGQGGHHRAVGAGSAGDREPRHLVGVPPRHGLLPGLVADPQGLAGGRRPARRGRRVGELAAVRLADQVLLLRARVRAVPDHLHRLVPGADDRPGDRRADTQSSRIGTGWHLRPCRPVCCSGTFIRSSRARSSRTRTGCPTCGTAAGSRPRGPSRALAAVSAYQRFLRVDGVYSDRRDIS